MVKIAPGAERAERFTHTNTNKHKLISSLKCLSNYLTYILYWIGP